MNKSNFTVAELIAVLQQMPPDAIVTTEAPGGHREGSAVGLVIEENRYDKTSSGHGRHVVMGPDSPASRVRACRGVLLQKGQLARWSTKDAPRAQAGSALPDLGRNKSSHRTGRSGGGRDVSQTGEDIYELKAQVRTLERQLKVAVESLDRLTEIVSKLESRISGADESINARRWDGAHGHGY